MANDALYRFENNYMCWIPETTFRKNDAVLDAANTANDDAYRMPGRFLYQPLLYRKVKRVYQRVANNLDWGYLGNHGYNEGRMTLTMEMIDLSILYYAVKGCTTTDDSPSGGLYTHVYATSTTRATTVPSFAIYQRITNDDSGNTMLHLYTGCVIHGFAITAGLDGVAQLTLDIRFANVVTANQLVTGGGGTGEPGFGVLKAYTLDYTSITYKYATTSYPGSCHGFEITYIDGTVVHKVAGDEFPSEALNGPRDIRVILDFSPKSTKAITDTLIAPIDPTTSDTDLDITIKMYRNATNDYTEFAFEKLWCINTPDGTWDFQIEDAIFLTQKPEFILKPTSFETGAKLTITEVNALDDDRYET